MAHGDHLKYSGKPKAGKKTFLRLISYVACDRRLLIVIGVLIVISIAANLTGSYMLRPIINDYILPGDFQGLVRILLFLAAIYLTGVAATYIEYILLNKIGQRTVTRMREELFGKMERLPVRYFDTHQHGDVMSRYTNDIDRISDALTDSLSDMLSSALTVIGIFCLMIFISPILTAVTLITVPLMFLSAKGIVKRSRKYFKAQQEALGMMNGYAEEMISGQKVVKVFGHEQKVETDFGILNQSLKDKSLKAQFYSGLMMPVMQNLNTLNYVIINIAIVALLYVGSIEINVGGMASGDVIALVNYMNQILIELVKLANLIVQVSKALACAGRVQAVLDTKPGMDFPAELRSEVPADKAGDAVRFDHVSLTYAGAGAPSLSDISFTAKRGQTIGVIGGTGSGKSSLVNLIPRFYDATEGTVEILGRPAADYPREALRGKVNVVMQKAQLFGGTIRSNLLWGNKNATDAELWAALETAQAAEFVQAKPLGLNEPVEQGGRNLSGGQKQRLTIARALVGKPDILILDDSASALDYATDAALRKALAALPGSLTVFIVSQRAASLQHADQILVLDDGRLVGLGTHDQLRQSCPVYEEIYESQFKKGDVQK